MSFEIQDWDYWITHIDTEEGLTQTEKEKAKSSLRHLKRFFGISLPVLAQEGHPIVWNYIYQFHNPSSRRWFVEFYDAIENVSRCNNSRKLVDKLKNREKFLEILFELDIANRFLKAGLNVEFYPKIDTGKVPDLKVLNPETKEEFFVEITELGQSVQAREVTETFDVISKKLFLTTSNSKPTLLFTGRIHKYLSNPHLKDILSKIDNALERCKSSGFEEIIEENVIELVIATDSKRDLLIDWASRRNMTGGFSGPTYQVDEIYRMATKMGTEQKQLPKDHLNIIIIRDYTFSFLRDNIDNTINRLEEYLYKYQHIAFCVITEIYVSGDEEKFEMKKDHFYLHKANGFIDRDILFLSNKFILDKSMTPNSASKIKEAFIGIRELLA